MKKSMRVAVWALLVAFLAGSLVSCSSWRSVVVNSTLTQVQLAKRNYKVINRVTGEYSATYVFGLFGPPQQDLVTQAWKAMEDRAELTDKARAIINVTVDRKLTWSPFHYKLTVYVSGMVVEFTD
ncbi:MAG: hypothetical protein J0L75_03250 [Spirochaetes bacterium]|nr:hypothetical protein [Spirochaetota bacterium]